MSEPGCLTCVGQKSKVKGIRFARYPHPNPPHKGRGARALWFSDLAVALTGSTRKGLGLFACGKLLGGDAAFVVVSHLVQ
ncbi:hypothetical protein MHY01S_24390 [Meiothermus hypogaeus NBRC 106114]|uniref:Uncharacterized protein n=1 Tax=Meiothermus hypogaeus NBRC 106114 TaxID=1227553 RepID=A0A511R3U0_9DEIN|nr:hypothetical protein MHY01S_24390 [Meiothermus hypogaeus NBRC 106114]